ncbi:MAG: hypothetical protein KF764_08765 [Labilithrix sp.]|nr:hypothetical protein [Labilithrix sp.]
MMELVIFVGSMLAPAAFFAGRYVRLRRTAPTPEPELCTGYNDENRHSLNAQRHDCEALRSVLCSDGRCSFHCATMCKCEREGATP